MIEKMKSIAFQAGTMALADMVRLSGENIHEKNSAKNLVTDADRRVEAFIVSELRRSFPDCGIYGEEGGKDSADREYCFIIDPIDGTVSFIHQLPNWCISIGLWRCNVPLAGVIYQPMTGDLYAAEAGNGAFMNGRRLRVSGCPVLEEAIGVTGFACLRAGWTEENNLAFFNRLAPQLMDVRKNGSAALDCCYVARGSVDFFWEMCLQPYDIAAGILMVSEAGGRVSDWHNGDHFPGDGTLVSNGAIHSAVLKNLSGFRNLKR